MLIYCITIWLEKVLSIKAKSLTKLKIKAKSQHIFGTFHTKIDHEALVLVKYVVDKEVIKKKEETSLCINKENSKEDGLYLDAQTKKATFYDKDSKHLLGSTSYMADVFLHAIHA